MVKLIRNRLPPPPDVERQMAFPHRFELVTSELSELPGAWRTVSPWVWLASDLKNAS